MNYRFLPVKKVHYGIGIVKHELWKELEQLNSKKVLLVTTKSLLTSKAYQEMKQLLESRKIEIFTQISRQHVPGDLLIREIKEIRAFSPDMIISFGGGSAIDASKMYSFILSEGIEFEKDLYPYSVNHKTKKIMMEKPLSHFTIPTTLSAAEFTNSAGVTNSMNQVKYKFYHLNMTPIQVFLDPDFTLETPEWLWLSTGMRAVDHAVETLYSPQGNPVNNSLALTAMTKLYDNLKLSKRYPDNLYYRMECQIGAWMSLFSNVNIKLGLSHSIGHQIGSLFDVPHGMTSAIMLPHVMNFLLPRTYKEQVQITEVLGKADKNNKMEENAKIAPTLIKELIKDLDIPHRLRDFNISDEGINKVVENIVKDIKGQDNEFVSNTSDLKGDITMLLKAAW